MTLTLQALEARIKELGDLKPGWLNDGYDLLKPGWLDGYGDAPSGAALSRSREVLFALLAAHPDIGAPGIFPTPTGGVQAEWDNGPWAIEIVFDSDGCTVEGGATNTSTFEDHTADLTGKTISEIASWLSAYR
jgi:hypothetical protein